MKIGQQREMDKTNIWLLLIDITASDGLNFNGLIDKDEHDNEEYLGAWANVLVKADTIETALEIAPLGLLELGFVIKQIDTTENLKNLMDDSLVGENVIDEANWLAASDYVFMISDKIFPYVGE